MSSATRIAARSTVAERRGYHHGDLRTALLVRAEKALRTTSVRNLSLRELARDVGVSHAAPRRHFADKEALLAALAEEGFHRLGRLLAESLDGSDESDESADAAMTGSARSFKARLTAFGRAYVTFALENAALLELMFARKHEPGSPGLRRAADEAFAVPLAALVQAQRDGEIIHGDPESLGTVVVAGLHGLAAMGAAGMVEQSETVELVEPLVHHLLAGLRPRLPGAADSSPRAPSRRAPR